MAVYLFPLLGVFLSSWLIWVVLNRDEPYCFSLAFIQALIFQATLSVLLNELLSLSQSLNRGSIAVFWLLVTAINLAVIAFFRSRSPGYLKNSFSSPFSVSRSFRLGRLEQLFLIGSVAVLASTLVTALIAPPNNWDSMTYRMPRVMHWIQNQSIHPYPTANLRQISFPPGNAYLITHVQLLSGGDYLANCIQWVAFLGSVVVIGLLTRQVLPGLIQPWATTIISLSIPMAIMQASTTQSDLLTAFWLSCYAYFIMHFDGVRKTDLFWMSAALALAIATKPTALIYGFPLTLILLVKLLYFWLFDQPRKTIKAGLIQLGHLLLVLVGALSLSFGVFFRNHQLFSTFLGDDQGTRVVNLGLKALLSNLVKNLYVNLPIWPLRSLIKGFHEWIGYDIYSQNSDLTVSLLTQPSLKFLAPHEDFVGAPIHIILFGLGCIVLLRRWIRFPTERRRLWPLALLAISILLAYICFSLTLKWSPFHNRLLLPLVILGVPVMSFGCQSLGHPRVQNGILLGLLVMALAYGLTSIRRPIVPLPVVSQQQQAEQSPSILTLERDAMYFSGARRELAEPYRQVAETLGQSQCRRIGLYIGQDDWEYPLWVLLSQQFGKDFKLQHVGVDNESAQLPPSFPDQELCAVIMLTTDLAATPWRPAADWSMWYDATITPSNSNLAEQRLVLLGKSPD